MTKIIPYWLYKTGYTDFPARDYDAAAKTIEFVKSWDYIVD